MSSDAHAHWLNPRLLITVLLIFLSGTLTGVLVMRFGSRAMERPRDRYWQEGGKQVSLERLTKELALTESQGQQLETILDDFMMYVQMLQAQMGEVRANGKERILRILDEEQRKKFEKLLGELQQARTP